MATSEASDPDRFRNREEGVSSSPLDGAPDAASDDEAKRDSDGTASVDTDPVICPEAESPTHLAPEGGLAPHLKSEKTAHPDAASRTDHDEQRESPMQTVSEDSISDETEVDDAADSAASTPSEPPTPEQVESLVKTYVISAMAVSMVPVPVFDVAALVALQLKMVHSLARRYDVRFSESLAKSLVLSLIGGVLPAAAVASAGSLLKLIPFAGSLVGGASMAILGGAVTYAVGRIFAEHFASGGTLLTFRPDAMRDRFRDLFKRGRKEAADLDATLSADEDETATAKA